MEQMKSQVQISWVGQSTKGNPNVTQIIPWGPSPRSTQFHACMPCPPSLLRKKPLMSARLPREPAWVIFWVCDGVDFHFPTLSFFVPVHLSLVLSTMKVTSLSTRWVWLDSVQFNLCPCLSLSQCAIFIARDSNVFCFNFLTAYHWQSKFSFQS